MASRLPTILAGTAYTLWLIWVILLYVGFHPHQLDLYTQHPYAGELLCLAVLVGGLGLFSFQRLRKKKKAWNVYFRGWHLIAISLLLAFIMIIRFWVGIGLPEAEKGSAFLFFIANSTWYIALLVALGLGLAAVGHIMLSPWKEAPDHPLVALAVGTMALGFLSSLLGLLGVLYGILLGIVLVAALVYKRHFVLAVLRRWIWEKHKWRQYHWWQIPVAVVGLVFISIYWVGGIKAFATGYDGSLLYANLAQLVGQTNSLPGAYQAFGWSVVMSWGQLLFGSSTINILLSHAMYLPALALTYYFIRKWLKSSYALLAVVLILTLPMMSFQTMVDEKVDLGLLFISIASLILLLAWKLPNTPPKWSDLWKSEHWYPAILLGLMLGFSFSIKYTTIFLIAGCISYVSFRYGKMLFWAWNLLFLGIIFLSGFYQWGNLPITAENAILLGAILFTAGLLTTAFHFWKERSQVIPWLFSLLVIGASFSLLFSPWAAKHLAESKDGLSVSALLYGTPDRISITVQPEYLSSRFNRSPGFDGQERSWSRLTQNTATAPQRESAATDDADKEDVQALLGNVQREELQRYLGYEEGIWRYLTIPFDLSANVNVAGLRHQEIGFFWLALLPFLFLGRGRSYNWLRNLGVGLLFVLLLSGWIWSLTEAQPQEDYFLNASAYQRALYTPYTDWQSSEYFYFWQSLQSPLIHVGAVLAPVFSSVAAWPALLFIPVLLGIFVALAKFLRWRYREWPKTLYRISIVLFTYLLLWALLGNSISWYAMLIWVLIPAIIIYYFQKPEEWFGAQEKKLVGYLLGTTLALQLAMNTLVVLSSSQLGQAKAQLFNWPMVSFMTSTDLDHFKTLALFDQYSNKISSILNKKPEARIYRINTYLQYHIERNNERVFEDNQLDRFARILSITEQADNFIDVLKDNGFEYVLYDLNTHTLDQTPEQSLRKKCERFINLMISTEKAELVLTDNFVAAPNASSSIQLPNGQMAQAQQGLIGNTLYYGRVALFRIK